MTDTDTRRVVELVSIHRLRADVAALATIEQRSMTGKSHRDARRQYLRSAFLGAGLKVRQHTFTYAGRPGINLLARKRGSRQDLLPLLISAHYDTVPGSPGADDNASGLAAMLECARALSGTPMARAVEFVAFDMEERQAEGEALVGSTAFVSDLATAAGYQGVYNLEMVGFTSGPGTQSFPPGFQLLFPTAYHHTEQRHFRGDSIAVFAQDRDRVLSQHLVTAAAQYTPELETVAVSVPEDIPVPSDLFRSDHSPFWAARIPAILLTDTANFRNPNYHTPHDTPDTLDYSFMYRVTCALVAAIARQAA